MDEAFKIPPKSPSLLTGLEKLKLVLKNLIGKEFKLTGKTRTDVSIRRSAYCIDDESGLTFRAKNKC